MRINICFGASADYLQHVGCIIASILANSKHDEDDYHFYVLSGDFTPKDKGYFEELKNLRPFEIEYIKMNDNDFEGAIHDPLGVSASYRLKIFELLSEDKVLYLDSDVIVRDDIRELYSTDISDYYCAGVEDKQNPNLRERVSMPDSETYINSGVLLLNLSKCRQDNIQEKMFNALRKIKYWSDQDAINGFMQRHIKLLDLKWNLMYPFDNCYEDKEYYEEVSKNPSIIHYTMVSKPWLPGSVAHMKVDYFKYLKLTPWYKDYFDTYVLEENMQIVKLLSNLLDAIK